MSFDRHDAHDGTTEAHERRIVRCSEPSEPSCRARIIWLKTDAGRNMPTDADTVEPADQLYDPKRHTSHFATCKSPQQFRRK
jgi:hypothetical protein